MDNVTLATRFVAGRIRRLQTEPNEGAVRAELAQLRRGIGMVPGEVPELWAVLFDGLPEELMSRNGKPTAAEWAISIALTLYALHQQGKNPAQESMHRQDCPLGASVHRLAGNDEDKLKAVRRRFNAMATAQDIEECAHYLRGLVQLLKAEDIPLDYVKLTEDLFWFQFDEGRQRVRLTWAQDFYKTTDDNKEENSNA